MKKILPLILLISPLLFGDIKEGTPEEIESSLIQLFELEDPISIELFDWGDGGSMGVKISGNGGNEFEFGTGVGYIALAKGNKLREILERKDKEVFVEGLYLNTIHWSKGDGIKIKRNGFYMNLLVRLLEYKARQGNGTEITILADSIIERINNPKPTQFMTMSPRDPDHPDHKMWVSDMEKRLEEKRQKEKE